MTGNSETIPHFRIKHEVFKNSFFPATIHEWNNLDQNIRSNITLRGLIFSTVFQSLYEPNLTVFLTAIILKDSN